MTKKFDVLVAGNGAIGNAIARELHRSDGTLRVGIIGRRSRPEAASSAAGAMLGCFGEVTAALRSSDPGRRKIKHAVEAAKLWTKWVDDLNAELAAENAIRIVPGTFVINNTVSGDVDDENYAAILATLDENKASWENVEPGKIPGFRPESLRRALKAIYIPNEGSVDSGSVLRAYDALAQRTEKLSLVDDAVKSVVVEGGRTKAVTTANGDTIECSQLIVAAGVGSQGILNSIPDVARRIPRVFPGEGHAVLLDVTAGEVTPCPNVLRTPNRSFACGLHQVPRGAGTVYIGATNHLRHLPQTRPTLSDMYFLLDCAQEQLHRDYTWSTLIEWKSGNRPVSIDSCPIVGATSVDGLWVVTGTYRDGFFQAPLIAKNIAAQVIRNGPVFDELFIPERKPIISMTHAEAIDEAQLHMLSAGAEHKLYFPMLGWHDTFSAQLKRLISEVYDQVASRFVLPPDFVASMQVFPGGPQYFRDYYAGVEEAWRDT